MTDLKLIKKKEILTIYTNNFGINNSTYIISSGEVKSKSKLSPKAEGRKRFILNEFPRTLERTSVTIVFADSKHQTVLTPKFSINIHDIGYSELINKEVKVIMEKSEVTGTLIGISDKTLIVRKNESEVIFIEEYKAISGPIFGERIELIGSVLNIGELGLNSTAEVSYSLVNVKWKAFYQILLDITGELYLFKGKGLVYNNSGLSYSDVELRLLTGEVEHQKVREYRPRLEMARASQSIQMKEDDEDSTQEISSGEHYSYVIPGFTSLETSLKGLEKEVDLFELNEFPVTWFYEYRIGSYETYVENQQLDYGIEFKAPKPLTEGPVEVFQQDEKNILGVYHGRGRMERTGIGAKVHLNLGKTMNLTGSHSVKSKVLGGKSSKGEVKVVYPSYDQNREITLTVTLLWSPKNVGEKSPTVRVYYPLGDKVFEEIGVSSKVEIGDLGPKRSFESSGRVVEKEKKAVNVTLISKNGDLRYDVGPLIANKKTVVILNFKLITRES